MSASLRILIFMPDPRVPDDGPTGGFFEDAGVVPW